MSWKRVVALLLGGVVWGCGGDATQDSALPGGVSAGGAVRGGGGAAVGGTGVGGYEVGGYELGGAPVGGYEAGGVPVGGREVGGSGGSAPMGGTDPGSCENVGCAAPPSCALGCTAPCGCCPCAEGDCQDIAGQKQCCYGGCWAPPDRACQHGGQWYAPGDNFSAGDNCNTCECAANGAVTCTALVCSPCNPALERNQREYLGDPTTCQLIKYTCPPNTTAFQNVCGCGCEQSPACPPWIDCMPGNAAAECADTEGFRRKCPYSSIAY